MNQQTAALIMVPNWPTMNIVTSVKFDSVTLNRKTWWCSFMPGATRYLPIEVYLFKFLFLLIKILNSRVQAGNMRLVYLPGLSPNGKTMNISSAILRYTNIWTEWPKQTVFRLGICFFISYGMKLKQLFCGVRLRYSVPAVDFFTIRWNVGIA